MDKHLLGNFLADLRNEKGLTQEQLAEMINVNYKTISKWECGNSLPGLDTLAELSEIFEVSLYEFSIYKRITNPLISKNNIKRVINEDSIKRFFILKLILLIFLIILLIFTTYSYIYTINNYNQMKVYELTSVDEYFHIDGLYVKTHDNYYLSIAQTRYLNENENFINDKTKSLQYSVIINNVIEEKNDIYFDDFTEINKALSSIRIYLSEKKISKDINHFYLWIKYDNEDKITVNKSFKIILSEKQANNKLFY